MIKNIYETSVGIVGQGFVGSSIRNFFENKIPLYTFDINGRCNCKTLDDLVKESELIFVCLPTPMKKNGVCDLSIVEETIERIFNLDQNKTIIIKSTIPPGTTDYLIDKFSDSIVFNPEFLTEANAAEDFKNQDRIIVGGYGDSAEEVYNFFKHFFTHSKIVLCSPKEAELTKYITNTFLSTKVAFANEIFRLCNHLNVDYSALTDIFTLDERLGKSHWSVPGPDNKYGFGGSCFPKDINALINFFSQNNIESPILKSVWHRNINIDRPEQDWKNLVGRAVSNDLEND